jgi:hypothetical protein
MKNKILIIISSFLILISLNSCSFFIKEYPTVNDFCYLQKGMEYSRVVKLYDMENAITFDFTSEGQKYKCIAIRVHSSEFNTGTDKNKMTFITMSPFFLVFTDSKLYNFGYLYQFKNSENSKWHILANPMNDAYKTSFNKWLEDNK